MNTRNSTPQNRTSTSEPRLTKIDVGAEPFEITVEQVLGKWAVTIYEMPGRTIKVQDFFPQRWEAVARANDFAKIIKTRNDPPRPRD